MNAYFNPKVIYAALGAALSGALAGGAISLESGVPTTRALFYAFGAALLTGFISGLTGWFKSQGAWIAPVAPKP